MIAAFYKLKDNDCPVGNGSTGGDHGTGCTCTYRPTRVIYEPLEVSEPKVKHIEFCKRCGNSHKSQYCK